MRYSRREQCKIKKCKNLVRCIGLCENHYRKSRYEKDKNRLYNIRSKVRNRIKLIRILGSKCKKCGNNNIFHLQFDHINDDGKEDRKKYNGTNHMIRAYLMGKEDIKRLQLLCANCNYEKQYRKNYMYGKVLQELWKKGKDDW